MKKLVGILAISLLVLSASAFAGDVQKKRDVKLTGYITDEWCGAANANVDGAGCAKACAKKGSALAIFAGGKLYKLSDKEEALKHLGHEVVVTGTLQEDGSVKVAQISPAEEKKG